MISGDGDAASAAGGIVLDAAAHGHDVAAPKESSPPLTAGHDDATSREALCRSRLFVAERGADCPSTERERLHDPEVSVWRCGDAGLLFAQTPRYLTRLEGLELSSISMVRDVVEAEKTRGEPI